MAEVERWARRRARSLRAFYTHVTAYLLMNLLLVLVDSTTPGDPWFYQPMLGWGMLLALHAGYAYEMLPWLGEDWERRKVRELMEQRLRD